MKPLLVAIGEAENDEPEVFFEFSRFLPTTMAAAVVYPSVQVPAGLQLVEGEDVGYEQFRTVIEDPNTTIPGEAVC